jgi:hypothetical protein
MLLLLTIRLKLRTYFTHAEAYFFIVQGNTMLQKCTWAAKKHRRAADWEPLDYIIYIILYYEFHSHVI